MRNNNSISGRSTSISISESEADSYVAIFDDDGHGDDLRETIEEYDPAQDSVLKEQLENERERALKVWSVRAAVFSTLQILPAVVLFFVTKSYISTILNVLIIISGYVASIKRRYEYAFVYLVANCLNILKDIVMMVAYKEVTTKPLPLAVFITDLAIFTPCGLYVSYYLYQSRKLVLIQ